ncbi:MULTISPECIES: cell division protein ZapA [Rubrivivax]|uniref:Cell division protein ZapA n=1 Tax=Rubrivivax benzoatilyticus TaxID=316997 RepID=A0ABX0HSL1_9BURK|nr:MULTISPECIES: cell division protein ZapA [Rubrivivax]MCD0418277.1 cell division protein ZapA [Rubrivivax sp. JA1024]EGJ11158.1 cell division protein ZapA [Rubrivivax benzoatilyticus JA2 = ATCC BAA-35]MCC9596026.1 cell division protein ZapA [Rubrivivax sp. JA1055]MCC9647633.1 cell division protein ZapA [Rubrivivax sp. JA1029]NHK97623.1 cell division protein ZapA [Rubrivivax benzoatilyticus]
MKQVEVTILGQGYILGCPEGGEALLAAAVAAVDREMSAIRDAGKVKARERIAVLAALNLAYQIAERGNAAAPAPAPAPAPQPEAATATSAADTEAIDALVRRLDAALGEDGHLL